VERDEGSSVERMTAVDAERDAVADCARRIASAIGARDTATLATLLDDEFVHRAPGGAATGVTAFLEGVTAIPGEIVSVRLEDLAIDVAGGTALATGIQHAEVRVDGQLITDRRGFVDWFVKTGDTWRIRVAVDLPAPSAAG
jgi:ketosteroid isomerase-like protein